MARYELDGTATGVAAWSPAGDHKPVGTRVSTEGESIVGIVLRTGRPARMHGYENASGPAAALGRELGLRSSVGAPIVVDQRLWGVMIVSSKDDRPLPADTESRIAAFTELVATAISNTEARTELAASRARIVAATDDERRRVVRDLHDGAQQRLVHTIITLKLARQRAPERARALRRPRDRGARPRRARDVELRELAHGILPAVLTRGGLRAGVQALASRMPVPVEIDVSVGPAPRCGRGDRLLRRRRGAHQRRETLGRPPRCGHGERRGRHPEGPRARRRRRAARGPTAAVCWGSPTGSPSSTASSASRARPTAARSSPQTSPSATSVRRPSGRFTRFRGAACGNRAKCGNVSAAEPIPRGNDAVRPAWAECRRQALAAWSATSWRLGGGGGAPTLQSAVKADRTLKRRSRAAGGRRRVEDAHRRGFTFRTAFLGRYLTLN